MLAGKSDSAGVASEASGAAGEAPTALDLAAVRRELHEANKKYDRAASIAQQRKRQSRRLAELYENAARRESKAAKEIGRLRERVKGLQEKLYDHHAGAPRAAGKRRSAASIPSHTTGKPSQRERTFWQHELMRAKKKAQRARAE